MVPECPLVPLTYLRVPVLFADCVVLLQIFFCIIIVYALAFQSQHPAHAIAAIDVACRLAQMGPDAEMRLHVLLRLKRLSDGSAWRNVVAKTVLNMRNADDL